MRWGAAIAVHPRWLSNDAFILVYGFLQIIVAFIVLVSGGYLADHVHGFQTSFGKFGVSDNIPYYSMMYYGGVAQAAYGSVFIVFAIAIAVVGCILDRHETERRWAKAAPQKEQC